LPINLDTVREALKAVYDIKDRLGRSGMATVYYAERLPDRRPVALKVLNPEFSRTVGAVRFHREIEFLRTLDHPNILPLLTSDKDDSLLYYVMPFATGGSLTTLLNDRVSLPVSDVVDVTAQVAGGLDYAHKQNIVHRDIKPGNVLFHEGRALICDFGIARAIVEAGGEHLSSSGLIIGTPAYMSPEQARGESELDGRSDIYSLACVVHEMLIGEPPFTGRSAQAVMAKHIGERPPSLKVVRPEIPQHVEDAVHAALAKDPAERPATAMELATKLANP
jgi:serine/threonine-protein kinase